MPLPSPSGFFRRRREDPPASPDEPPLPAVALEWLRETLHDAFAAPAVPAVPEEGEADALRVWRREFLRRWRRLRLPEQLEAYGEALRAARSPDDVDAAFREHAAAVVGASRCVLVPGGAAGSPVAAAAVVPSPPAPGEALAPLAALFAEAGAASLLVAPYGEGAAALVERRSERAFTAADGELMELMAAEAGLALRRLRLLAGEGAGGSEAERAERVLRHARAGAALGMEITCVRFRLREGAGGPEEPAVWLRRAVHAAARDAGPVLGTGDGGVLLVIMGGAAAAEALAARVREAAVPGLAFEASVEEVAAPPPGLSAGGRGEG